MMDVIFPKFLLFLFNFNAQCRAVIFVYITVFQEDSKQGSMVGRWVGRSVESELFILRF